MPKLHKARLCFSKVRDRHFLQTLSVSLRYLSRLAIAALPPRPQTSISSRASSCKLEAQRERRRQSNDPKAQRHEKLLNRYAPLTCPVLGHTVARGKKNDQRLAHCIRQIQHSTTVCARQFCLQIPDHAPPFKYMCTRVTRQLAQSARKNKTRQSKAKHSTNVHAPDIPAYSGTCSSVLQRTSLLAGTCEILVVA